MRFAPWAFRRIPEERRAARVPQVYETAWRIITSGSLAWPGKVLFLVLPASQTGLHALRACTALAKTTQGVSCTCRVAHVGGRLVHGPTPMHSAHRLLAELGLNAGPLESIEFPASVGLRSASALESTAPRGPRARAKVFAWAAGDGEFSADFRYRILAGAQPGRWRPMDPAATRFACVDAAVADALARLMADLRAKIAALDQGSPQPESHRAAVSALFEWAEAHRQAREAAIARRAAEAQALPPLAGWTYFDAFAGIGGFSVAMQTLGARCAGACDVDPGAREIYALNFGHGAPMHADIRAIDASALPDFDLLCAGFPCQPFSIAGAKAGFDDTDRGDLFFEIVRLAREKRPSALLLENVPRFGLGDDGAACDRALEALCELGYDLHVQALDSGDFGLAQARARLFIVGQRTDGAAGSPADARVKRLPALGSNGGWAFPAPTDRSAILADALDCEGDRQVDRELDHEPGRKHDDTGRKPNEKDRKLNETGRPSADNPPRVFARPASLGVHIAPSVARRNRERALATRQRLDARAAALRTRMRAVPLVAAPAAADAMDGTAGLLLVGLIDGRSAQGYRVYSPKGKAQTLCAQGGGLGGPSGLYWIGDGVRNLTAQECLRLQGFPAEFRLPASERIAKRLLGNAVSPPVVRALALQMARPVANPAVEPDEPAEKATRSEPISRRATPPRALARDSARARRRLRPEAGPKRPVSTGFSPGKSRNTARRTARPGPAKALRWPAPPSGSQGPPGGVSQADVLCNVVRLSAQGAAPPPRIAANASPIQNDGENDAA